MPRMIPTVARFGANSSERRLFSALEGAGREEWVVFHSLTLRQHLDKLTGEADFVVLVPGKGLVVIEAKSPSGVHYRDGVWTLDGVPQPRKSPLEQVDGAARSIRAYLMREGVIEGNEPIARLLWFTSIGRHHFTGRAPSDLSFFEWELAWADDLRHAASTIEKTLDEHIAWHESSARITHDPEGVSRAKVKKIVSALTRDFSVSADERDAQRDSERREAEVLAEQRFALEIVDANRAVYFDGPAGTGKSHLLAHAAMTSASRGERTLLTCWNVVMASRLREATATQQGPLVVADLATIMLRAAGLDAHPEGATNDWYQDALPVAALAGLAERPQVAGYRHVVVDEFQDIAGSPALVDFVLALAGVDGRVMLAGDERQQIMRPLGERVDPYAVAKSRLPDLVLARIRRNCRQVPQLASASEAIVGRKFGFTGHRLPASAPGSAERVTVSAGKEVAMLAGVLRLLTQKYGPDRVAVLSPWGARSLASRVISREVDAAGDDARWLRAQLGDAKGKVAFGSISKLKGIEVDAVIVTDAGAPSREWTDSAGLDWDDLMYVALSRAKYDAVVLEERAGG